MMMPVHVQDGLRLAFFAVIGLHFRVDRERYDVHVDFDGKRETVNVHDDEQEDTADGNTQRSAASRC
jgi:hypothetical protein